MAKCPKCGVEVTNPMKTWVMVGRPDKSGGMLQLTMGLYECTSCKKRFRNILSKEKITLKGMIQKIRMLEVMVMEAAKRRAELEEKIKALEEEKSRLLAEIEALKVIPELEAKAVSLEAEVDKLKEEKKALEEKVASPPEEALPTTEEKTCEEKTP